MFIKKWERRYFELIYLREPDHHVLRYYEDEQRTKVKVSSFLVAVTSLPPPPPSRLHHTAAAATTTPTTTMCFHIPAILQHLDKEYSESPSPRPSPTPPPCAVTLPQRSIELSPAAGVKLFCNIPSQEHKNVFCLVEEKRSRKFFCAADSGQSELRWVGELRKACPHLDPSVVVVVPPTDPAAPVIGAPPKRPPTYDTLTQLVDDPGQNDESLSARSNVTESASITPPAAYDVIEADSPLRLMYEKRGVDAFGPSRDDGGCIRTA